MSMTKETITDFLDKVECPIIDEELIDKAIEIVNGNVSFDNYTELLSKRNYLNDIDYYYYNIGFVAQYGLSYSDKEDNEYFNQLVK